MGARIVLIIIIVAGLGLGLYLYTSGVFVQGISQFNSLINVSSTFSLFHISTSSTIHGPSAPVGPAAPTGSSQSQETSDSSQNGTPAINPANIPAGYTLAQLSPYFREVSFGGVSAGSFYNYGTITLNAYFNNSNATGTIDITGWLIKSSSGNEYIPKAVNMYDPTGLAPATDINIKNGDTVYLYSSSAPLNLRLNKCIGYAAHVANFVPALPQSCPYIDRAQLRSFSSVCQNYLNSIGSCQSPDLSSVQVPRNDYACMNYIENNFTYRSCFNAHSADADFLSNQVWVWTGDNIIDSYNGTISLFDNNGLLVSTYDY
jgi:hypothetical protein